VRVVHQGDGVAWLRETTLPPDAAIVTSLPDLSELPELGLDGWRQWFLETATLVCTKVPGDAVAIFYQTDIKIAGRWIDKAYLVQRAAEIAGVHQLWHKIACRVPPGTTTFGRPAYGHVLCFSRGLVLDPGRSTPDVLPELGTMPWSRAMGTAVCAAVCRFLLDATACRTVVDPFCGLGTMLAVANAHGLDAIGVERSAKRVRKALALRIEGDERPPQA
jgi:hypothetical protein